LVVANSKLNYSVMEIERQDTDGVKITLGLEEYTEIVVNNVMVVIKHNDVGVSIDTYKLETNKDPEHRKEDQVWFDDFE